MKKYLLLFVCLFLTLGTLFSTPVLFENYNSTQAKKKVLGNFITMGPKISLLLTDVHFNSTIKAGYAPGFGIGIFFKIGKTVYFQPEISYSLRQFRFDPVFKELDDNSKFFTHNLSFAPMIGCSIIKFENFKLNIFLGPEGGVLLKNGYKGDKDPWTKFEFGGQIGIGFELYHATFDVGYKYLMSKNSDQIDPLITTAYQRQNMIFFSIGYCIF